MESSLNTIEDAIFQRAELSVTTLSGSTETARVNACREIGDRKSGVMRAHATSAGALLNGGAIGYRRVV
jgi:hypothetical protein